MKKVHPIINFWVTPKLPRQHLFIHPENRPKSVPPMLGLYLKRWLFHPLKKRLAKHYLAFLRHAFGLKVIGVTGSAGKTSTKEMIASILKLKGSTVFSYANVDPIYNIPSTILRCSPSTKYLVLEMGVEFPGEMDFYLWLVTPDVGVITNIYPTHTQFFGSVEGVFREKSKLARGLTRSGVAILNGDDPWLTKLKGKLTSEIVWYGEKGSVISSSQTLTKEYKTRFLLRGVGSKKESVWVDLPIAGSKFVANALAAAASALSLGFSLQEVKKGLEEFRVPEHRMQIIKHKSGALIIDDSYNNNPVAATLAIEASQKIAGGNKLIVVFGDMLELGRWEKQYHETLGQALAKVNPALLICVGKASRLTYRVAVKTMGQGRVRKVDSWDQATPLISPELKGGVTVLVKGSRSVGLDKLVSELI